MHGHRRAKVYDISLRYAHVHMYAHTRSVRSPDPALLVCYFVLRKADLDSNTAQLLFSPNILLAESESCKRMSKNSIFYPWDRLMIPWSLQFPIEDGKPSTVLCTAVKYV